MKNVLTTKGNKIVTPDGKSVHLRGVNLGGWLMMEAYFLHSPNRAVHLFKQNFRKKLGRQALNEFEQKFRDNFIQEHDIKNIKRYGFNCIRLPFNYRMIEKNASVLNLSGVKYIDRVVRWAKKYKIYIILDLHAAPGAQNHDWHSDSDGTAKLWTNSENQARTVRIWELLADRYKNETYIAGYDLLNEAVLENDGKLNRLYNRLIKHIRQTGSKHILFIEGNKWATDIECLDHFKDDNYALSIHNYEPIDFTFNFVPFQAYPLKSKRLRWNKAVTRRHLSNYQKIGKKHNVPIFVGEFGVNSREGLYGEQQWVDDTLSVFNQLGFHWTYWTYKAVKNSVFPDGIFSYKENPPWVNRQGPLMGWETYHLYWPKLKNQMVRSWRTEAFDINKPILTALRKHAH